MSRRVCAGVTALAAAASFLLAAEPARSATRPAQPYDFNGDGQPELVVGAPGLEVKGHEQAGGLVVVQQSPNEVSRDRVVITQSTARVVGASEDGDHFGSAVVSADFDSDGYADLAVGQPDEDVSRSADVGAVTVLYGTKDGLTGARSAQLTRPGGGDRSAGFGAALAVGDLDGDSYPDLAVGAPRDDVDTSVPDDYPPSGTVTVLRGSRDGVSARGGRVLRGLRSTAAYDHEFGSALAVGDVDGDSRPDLVVAAAGHLNLDGTDHAGAVSFCAGAAGCRQLVSGPDLEGNAAVVVGNVSGDARPEIVLGVPSSAIDFAPGHLQVLTLSGSGPATTAAARRYAQGDFGVPGADLDGTGDDFGAALALRKVAGSPYADLIIGAPSEEVDEEDAGRVVVVRGGLGKTGNLAFDEDTPGLPGGAEEADRFGASLTVQDRNADGVADLVVGAPGENDDGGSVSVLRGTATTFTTAGSGAFSLATYGYRPRSDARLGAALGQ